MIFLFQFKSIFVGFFSEETKNQFARLLVTHLAVAFANYDLNFEEISKLVSDFTLTKDCFLDFSKPETLHLKILECYFFKPICLHFNNMYEEIKRNEEMNLNYIKFKNLYIVDLSNDRIIFDLLKSRKNRIGRKYYNNERIWQEIIFHSQQMKSSYYQELRNVHDMNDAMYRVSFKIILKKYINIIIYQLLNYSSLN